MTRNLALLTLAALVAVVGSCTIDYTAYTLEVEETRAWAAGGISEFYTTTWNGEVSVAATQFDTDSVTVLITRSCSGKDSADAAAHIDEIVVSDTSSSTAIALDTDLPTSTTRHYGADFDVSMPTGIMVDLNTTNGAVSVTGTLAAADVWTSNGTVATDGTRGQLTIRTTNGNVTITDHIGSAEVSTHSGGIECGLALPEASQTADLGTANGNVTLSLPADAAVTFDATTTTGTVTVEGFASVDYTTNEEMHKAGTIGGGGATVTIATSNANVTIKAE